MILVFVEKRIYDKKSNLPDCLWAVTPMPLDSYTCVDFRCHYPHCYHLQERYDRRNEVVRQNHSIQQNFSIQYNLYRDSKRHSIFVGAYKRNNEECSVLTLSYFRCSTFGQCQKHIVAWSMVVPSSIVGNEMILYLLGRQSCNVLVTPLLLIYIL